MLARGPRQHDDEDTARSSLQHDAMRRNACSDVQGRQRVMARLRVAAGGVADVAGVAVRHPAGHPLTLPHPGDE